MSGAAFALRLRPTAATDTLVGRSSAAYRDTQGFYARFGEEPVEVLVKGDLRKLVLSSDIERLVGLEGCLSGKLPPAAVAQEGGARGPCGQLTRIKSVKVVFGPGRSSTRPRSRSTNSSERRPRGRSPGQAGQTRSSSTSALARGLGRGEAPTLGGTQARKATMAGFAAEISALAIRYGLTSAPQPRYDPRIRLESRV